MIMAALVGRAIAALRMASSADRGCDLAGAGKVGLLRNMSGETHN